MSSRLRNDIAYDCVCDFLNVFFYLVFVPANHTQSTRGTSAIFPSGCTEKVFTRLRVLKERSTVQVVPCFPDNKTYPQNKT